MPPPKIGGGFHFSPPDHAAQSSSIATPLIFVVSYIMPAVVPNKGRCGKREARKSWPVVVYLKRQHPLLELA